MFICRILCSLLLRKMLHGFLNWLEKRVDNEGADAYYGADISLTLTFNSSDHRFLRAVGNRTDVELLAMFFF